MGVLGVYLIWSGIILLVSLSAYFGYSVNKKDIGNSIISFSLFLVTLIVLILATEEYHEPKAIEVYQGKTTLEYTVKDGVRTDSVVVYKEGIKK